MYSILKQLFIYKGNNFTMLFQTILLNLSDTVEDSENQPIFVLFSQTV